VELAAGAGIDPAVGVATEYAALAGGLDGLDGAERWRGHQSIPILIGVRSASIGASSPGVTAGGVGAPLGHFAFDASLRVIGDEIDSVADASTTRGAGGPIGSLTLWLGLVKALQHLVEVEAQSPANAAEPDVNQFPCVRVDPVALDAQVLGECRGVDVAALDLGRAVGAQPLRHKASDLLDVGGVESHGSAGASDG